ncbi:hypothetical protein HK405_000116, partial [Cladochytrium tenue]
MGAPGVHRYWGRPDATAEAIQDGWFLTGDIGCATEAEGDGAVAGQRSFKILGRASVDIIKSGGFKLSALEIERELLAHPRVHDAAVVGVTDDTWGERVVAVLVAEPAPGGEKGTSAEQPAVLDAAELKAFLRGRLAPYQVPSEFRFMAELPRNAMGKVGKKELRKTIEAEVTVAAATNTMSDLFAEEIEALQAIYGDEFSVDEYARYAVAIPGLGSLLFWASERYPADAPPAYRLELDPAVEWRDRNSSGDVHAELQRLWLERAGSVVVYDWVEWLRLNKD